MVTHPLWRPYELLANADRQGERIAHRQVQPEPLHEHQTRWFAEFSRVRALIEAALHDEVLAIAHVGSTAVPGLVAKPVLDIDLTVPHVQEESAYIPRLEAAGFRLIFRDHLGGDAHRQLTFAAPNTNLHVWNPRAVEPQRHQLFTTYLRTDKAARDRYAAAKRAAASDPAAGQYNDLKSAVVYDIYELAFLADPDQQHDPQPRGSPAG